ncbi:PEP-CTERM sorting domain-containing protein [Desulfobacterales bacterium HSG17]|nr:PEP-CTERM sorting domain-containing protein [Desulfobacterales bacterium HSG17]
MKSKFRIMVVLAFLLFPFATVNAGTIAVDLNDFYADLSVYVSADGSSATMYEDEVFMTVFLSNDPYLDDPGIPVPENLLSLNFEYTFTEAIDNDDEFFAWVFDGDSGDEIDFILLDESDSGTVSWDLSGIDPAITLLGLEFQLSSWENSVESFVNIDNVYLTTASSTSPVPEPGTMFLLSSGLIGLFSMRRRNNKS